MKRELNFRIGNQEVTVTAAREGHSIVVQRGDESFTVEVLGDSGVVDTAVVSASGSPTPSVRSAPSGTTAGAVASPMTGVVDQVLIKEGGQVAEGDKIVILEAMKMYIDVFAPAGGTVSTIAVAPGDNVKEGQTLLTIE